MRKQRFAVGLTVLALLSAVPVAAGGFGIKRATPEEKRTKIREERDKMLERLFEHKPELRERISTAPGYGAFSNRSLNLLLLASGNGYGVVVDNDSGEESFMRMASLGAGVGYGVRDLDVIFIFNDRATMREFVEKGWQFGAHADASVEVKGRGGGVGESAAVDTAGGGGLSSGAAEVVGAKGPIEIYELTDVGVALQAVVAGTKYWGDGKLNN